MRGGRPRGFAFLLAVLAVLLLAPATMAATQASPATAPSSAAKRPPVEVDTELDAYYSNLGIFIPLTGEPIPDLAEQSETAIYRHLLFTSWPPRFALVEFSVNPMPILGVYLKRHHRDLYDRSERNDVNLVQSITAGFEEPYAISLFFGNVATFVRRGQPREATNKGYMGYLFSFGNRHIKDNELINDDWLEAEWKLKGDRSFAGLEHHWSFRLGTTLHGNPGIADAVYLGLRRSLLDFHGPVISWFNDSEIDLRTDFALHDGRFLRQEAVIGRKFPLGSWHVALTFDLGFIWESAHRYAPRYRDPADHEITLVLRPNLEF